VDIPRFGLICRSLSLFIIDRLGIVTECKDEFH